MRHGDAIPFIIPVHGHFADRCGDYPAYALENRKIVPLEVQDGVDPYDANVNYTYIRVYEYYKKGGWIGRTARALPLFC